MINFIIHLKKTNTFPPYNIFPSVTVNVDPSKKEKQNRCQVHKCLSKFFFTGGYSVLGIFASSRCFFASTYKPKVWNFEIIFDPEKPKNFKLCTKKYMKNKCKQKNTLIPTSISANNWRAPLLY